MSLAHFRGFGWEPIVLTVDADYVEGVQDPVLACCLPPEVQLFHVRALPLRWTRKFGLGSLGLRAFPFLYQEGRRLIRRCKIDLVYFSTTMFPAMALGRLWKTEFGVPFVLDMQDPWVSDYQEGRNREELPPKFWFMDRVHRILEPWTMKKVDGLIAVSSGYIETLCRRYPWLKNKPAMVLPFAAAETDFEVLREHPQPNRFFVSGEGDRIHGVYVGRGGCDMRPALRIIFGAFRRGLEVRPDLFNRVHLHFIGTDYAADHRSKKTVEPIALECGVSENVHESPQRIPYFEVLQLLKEADFLVVPGSDDPQYSASKIFPYILARKPLLCVFQQSSNVCDTVERLHAGTLLRFKPELPPEVFCDELYTLLSELLFRLPYSPDTDWKAFESMGAREGTRKQCDIFDQVYDSRHSKSFEPAALLSTEPASHL